MAKTNYTKVEGALKEGLDKMQKEKLLEEADLAQGKKPKKQHLEDQLVAKIRQEIKNLHKHDKDLFVKIGVEEKLVRNLLTPNRAFTDKDWMALKVILQKIEAYRTDLEKRFPAPTNEELVDQEMKKSVNRRFNVNDKWLPLK